MRISRNLQRGLALLLVPAGLACLAFPVARLFLPESAGMIDDTHAWLGAGTAEGVPAVSQVSCIRQSFGSSSGRGVGLSQWSCTIDLDTAEQRPAGNPFAGMSYEEAMRENVRQIAALSELLRPENIISGRIERVLATDHTGQPPAVRRLSAEGQPPRFGLVWSGWEIAGRWLLWLVVSGLFIAFGLACLYAARRAWRPVS